MAYGLQPFRFKKNWNKDTATREENWDELATAWAGFSVQTNNNFRQIGIDINGGDYQFNGVGQGTQSPPIITRLDNLEALGAIVAIKNLALDLTTPSILKLVAADGSTLNNDNRGQVFFNSTTTAGLVITRDIVATQQVTLTGAHWGLDTLGDYTDVKLWPLFMDTGSAAVLGVSMQGGRPSVASTDVFTAAASVVSLEDILAASAVAGTVNISHMGWINADFDDTGNAGGENFWTLQSSPGDVGVGPVPVVIEGLVYF